MEKRIRVVCMVCSKMIKYKSAEGGEGGDSHSLCPACASDYVKEQKAIIAEMRGGAS